MEQPPDGAVGPRPAEGDPFAAGADRARYVRAMFASIAPRYDVMNTLMTAGLHRAWRRLAARALVRPGDRVVDVGCGTGDFAFALAESGAGSVLGVDFAAPMVARAREKSTRGGGREAGAVTFTIADATALPVASGALDAWCSAFVVRNVPDVAAALAEAHRVLRPSGRLAILDLPRMEGGPAARAGSLYMGRIVPLLGRAVSRNREAYSYLPQSVGHFLSARELTAALRRAGFRVTEVRMLALGGVSLHLAERRER